MTGPRLTPARFALLLAGAYLLINGFTVLHHEIWRDEAQTWLTVRDNDLFGVLGATRWAGAPPLWFLLLFPFAKAGCGILAQQIVHLVIATGTVYVIARYAPWSRLLTVLLAAGYYLGFEYVIVSRSYALGIFLLFAITALDSRRHQRPLLYGGLVALMANISGHFLVIAAGFGLAYAVELVERERRAERWIWLGAGLMLIGGLTSLALLSPPAGFRLQGFEPHPGAILETIEDALFPGPVLSSPVFLALSVLATGSLLLYISRSRRALLVVGVVLSGLFYIAALRHAGGLRHRGLFLLVMLSALWLADRDRQKAPFLAAIEGLRSRCRARTTGVWLVQLGLLVSIDFTVAMHRMDWQGPFSGGAAMAEHLRSLPVLPTLAVHDSAHATAVLVHLPAIPVWQLDRQAWGSYFREDPAYEAGIAIDDDALITRVREGFRGELPWLLLNHPLSEPEARGYAGVHAVEEGIFGAEDEAFYLYRPLSQ